MSTESGNLYHDQHTLYVKSGVAYNSQLLDCMKRAIENVSQLLNRTIKCQYQANLIVGRNGKYYGYGYMFVTNPEVYYMLIGKNPDGTDRVAYDADINWKVPDKPLETSLAEIPTHGSWADMTEEEERITELYTCPKIKRELPPLMELPGYDYDEEQSEHLRQVALTEGNTDPIPRKGYFQISPASVRDVDERFCPNVLCSRDIPTWMSEFYLKQQFSPYASDRVTSVTRKIKRKIIMDTYPFVTINDSRVTFITFNPATRDAQFALLMTKKMTLTSNKGDKCTLVFNHSFNTGYFR